MDEDIRKVKDFQLYFDSLLVVIRQLKDGKEFNDSSLGYPLVMSEDGHIRMNYQGFQIGDYSFGNLLEHFVRNKIIVVPLQKRKRKK